MLRTAMFQGSTKLRDTNLYGIILILIILTGIIGLSFADIMDKTAIHNTGKIIAGITAQSGSARDIQAAVDLAAAVGVGIVRITEGTFNFVEVGEPWKTVEVPAGVSIFGAPTERDANDQVIEWKTVLVMPSDVPGNDTVGIPAWFLITGYSDPNKPSRFSDIKLVGYRDFDPNSTSMHRAIIVDSVIDFRIDHCFFKHTCGGGVHVTASSGVIDHCILANDYGIPTPYQIRTVGYGVYVKRDNSETEWEPDLTKILGKYNNYTVFIEDCLFTKWRHCTVGNLGAHIVFRHNIIDHDFAYGSIDMHQMATEPYVSGRAYEVYENQLINPEPVSMGGVGCGIRSGSGVFFNNTVRGHNYFIYTWDSGWNPDFYPHDLYIWTNDFDGQHLVGGSAVLDEDYFLYKPDWYSLYPYPHPLTK